MLEPVCSLYSNISRSLDGIVFECTFSECACWNSFFFSLQIHKDHLGVVVCVFFVLQSFVFICVVCWISNSAVAEIGKIKYSKRKMVY